MSSNLSWHQVLLNSNQLKRLIIERSFDYKIPLQYLCAEVGVEYRDFMASYINATKNPSGVTETEFLQILDILGIKVRHQIIIDTGVDVEKNGNALTAKWEGKLGKRTKK